MVTAIDQSILLLSIPEMQNLESNIMGFEPESILIIISCVSSISKKEGNVLRVIHTAKSASYLWSRS